MQVDIEQIEWRRMAIRARGNEIIVDDTLEAGGPGDGWRPSELLLGGLGACMIGTMLTFAKNQGIEVTDVSMHLEDTPLEHPERIGTIDIRMELGTDATEKQRKTLERVAGRCKIHNTLERPPTVNFDFVVAD